MLLADKKQVFLLIRRRKIEIKLEEKRDGKQEDLDKLGEAEKIRRTANSVTLAKSMMFYTTTNLAVSDDVIINILKINPLELPAEVYKAIPVIDEFDHCAILAYGLIMRSALVGGSLMRTLTFMKNFQPQSAAQAELKTKRIADMENLIDEVYKGMYDFMDDILVLFVSEMSAINMKIKFGEIPAPNDKEWNMEEIMNEVNANVPFIGVAFNKVVAFSDEKVRTNFGSETHDGNGPFCSIVAFSKAADRKNRALEVPLVHPEEVTAKYPLKLTYGTILAIEMARKEYAETPNFARIFPLLEQNWDEPMLASEILNMDEKFLKKTNAYNEPLLAAICEIKSKEVYGKLPKGVSNKEVCIAPNTPAKNTTLNMPEKDMREWLKNEPYVQETMMHLRCFAEAQGMEYDDYMAQLQVKLAQALEVEAQMLALSQEQFAHTKL